MNFFTKIDRGSNPIFELEDIERMTRYKTELINSLVYDPPNSLSKRKSLSDDALKVDEWLRKHYHDFVLDNNRSFDSKIKSHWKTRKP